MGTFGWHYPPGVSENMIPGFRPQDEEAERFIDNLDDEQMVEYAQSELLGDVIYDDEGEWFVEEDEGEKAGPFHNEDEAVSYALVARENSITEALVTAHLEQEPDEREPDYEPDYDDRY